MSDDPALLINILREEPTMTTASRKQSLSLAAARRCDARAEAAFLAGDTDAGHAHLELASAHRAAAGLGEFRSAGARLPR